MSIYIILASAFIAAFSIVLFFSMPKILKTFPKKNLARLDEYGAAFGIKKQDTSVFKKSIAAGFLKLLSGTRKILPKNLVESVKTRLELAGIQEVVRVDVFLAVKFFMPFIFLFTLIFLMLFFSVPTAPRLLLIILIPFSYMLPDYYLKSRIAKRQDEIKRTLPNALDLLTISVEAGLGFDQALIKVANNIKGTLGEEFKRAIKEMEIGMPRKEALRNLGKRTDVAELNTFIFSIIQADIFGISVGKVLRVQASEMRIKRRQIAEEKGLKAPVKLVFPTILFLFPALMVIVLGPAGIRMWDTLKLLMQ
ncbi:MAG: type II secretion system F family protein [Actinobacteria bacterium]|nr:type II secretion system F family protein [Actinomycetota bacterium]